MPSLLVCFAFIFRHMLTFIRYIEVFSTFGLLNSVRYKEDFVISPGGGSTHLYGLCRYVRPQRVWFFSRFGHKWIDFSHFAAILVINRVSIFAL